MQRLTFGYVAFIISLVFTYILISISYITTIPPRLKEEIQELKKYEQLNIQLKQDICDYQDSLRIERQLLRDLKTTLNK